MRALEVAMAAALLAACHATQTIEVPFPDPAKAVVIEVMPAVGSPPPVEPHFSHVATIASSNSGKAFYARFRGIVFEVAVDRQNIVSYVATDDPAFATPEGIHVGAPFEQAIQAAGQQPFHEPGWACHVALPSGWQAAAQLVGQRLHPCADKVSWLFQRR